MKYFYNALRFFVMLAALTSCGTSLPEEPAMTETVADFAVSWQTGTTDKQKETVRQILNNMVLVPAGEFVMGASSEQLPYARKNELPNAYVRLSNYYICKFEVTDDEYDTITGDNKSSKYYTLSEYQHFINILRDMTGLCFDFPSEAQWEYAARGAHKSMHYLYPGSNNLDQVNSYSYPDGSKHPNEIGLYNMADLKGEWCKDSYALFPTDEILVDWIQLTGYDNVVRGGNYRCTATIDNYNTSFLYSGNSITKKEMDSRHCRVSSRSYYSTKSNLSPGEIGTNIIGLRLTINTQLQ